MKAKYRSTIKDANIVQWGQLKRKVFARDHYTCQRCDYHFPHGQGLTAHHITPREEGGGTYLENLISLCGPCHNFVEVAGNLRTHASIEGSYEVKRNQSVPVIALAEIEKANIEGRDAYQRPDWHAWVYGGQRRPDYSEEDHS